MRQQHRIHAHSRPPALRGLMKFYGAVQYVARTLQFGLIAGDRHYIPPTENKQIRSGFYFNSFVDKDV
jgi:hypothetical protein